MHLETWWLFFVSYLVITLAPGPNVMFVVKNAVQHNYTAAIVSILGNLSCQLFIVALVGVGAGTLLAQSPTLFIVLKILGGSYLIYLGFCGIVSNKSNTAKQKVLPNPQKIKLPIIYLNGFMVSASNPKTVIFLSAFLPQFIVADLPLLLQFSTMFTTISIIVVSVHLAYSCAILKLEKELINTQLKRCFLKLYHSLFIIFGTVLVLNK